MATKIPAPVFHGTQQPRQRSYTSCAHRWSWTPTHPTASRLPVARRRHIRHSSAASSRNVRLTGIAEGGAPNFTNRVEYAKRKFALSTIKGNTTFDKPALGIVGEHEKGCKATGPGPCGVTGCFGSVTKHRMMFEELASPPKERAPDTKRVSVKTYWLRAESGKQEENQHPARTMKVKLPTRNTRAAFIKNESNGQGSIGRRIRPALAGLFDTVPHVAIPPLNDPTASIILPSTGRGLAPCSMSTAGPATTHVTRPLKTPTHKRDSCAPEETHEQDILRRLEEAHLTAPVFLCAGPRNMNDYSEGPLTDTFFGDPREDDAESLRRAGIKDWVKGTLKGLRLTGAIAEDRRAWELPRGWLEEGE